MDGATEGYGDSGSLQIRGLEMASGKSIKDLNESLRISGDSYRRNAKLSDGVMRFWRSIVYLLSMSPKYNVFHTDLPAIGIPNVNPYIVILQ